MGHRKLYCYQFKGTREQEGAEGLHGRKVTKGFKSGRIRRDKRQEEQRRERGRRREREDGEKKGKEEMMTIGKAHSENGEKDVEEDVEGLEL